MDTQDRKSLDERTKSLLEQAKRRSEEGYLPPDLSPLYEAVSKKDLAEIIRLLDTGVDINERSWSQSTPLLEAVQAAGRMGEDNTVRLILQRGRAQAETGTVETPTLGQVVAEERESRRREADADTLDPPQPLREEDRAVIRLLLERGADLNARDRWGHTVLHRAAVGGLVELADMLLAAGAEIDAKDKQGSTPLMASAAYCRLPMLRFLLERGAKPHVRTERGGTTLMSAASGGSRRIIQILLDQGVEMNAEEEDGTTALLTAAMRGHDGVVEQLRRAGADVGLLEAVVLDDAALRDRLAREPSVRARTRHWGRSVVMWAVGKSRSDIIRYLYQQGASVNGEDDGGRTPMLSATMQGDEETMRTLIECGASVQKVNWEFEFSPLCWAVSHGNLNMVNLLIAGGADVDEMPEIGDTPLLSAINAGNVEIVRALLDGGADPELQRIGMSPMWNAVRRNDLEIVRLLVEHGAKLYTTFSNNGTETKHSFLSMPEVKKNPELYSFFRMATGTELHDALKAGDNEKALSLLTSGCDVNAQDEMDFTALEIAVERGDLVMAQQLLSRGANPHLADRAGRTPLHCAVQRGYREIAHLLVEHGADIDREVAHGMTPLLTAVLSKTEGKERMITWLIEAGARVGIQEAAGLGDIATLRNLLDLGRDVNEANGRGVTALMAAAETNQAGVLEVLMARGASLDRHDNDDNTALTRAFLHGNEEAVRYLISAGADLNGAWEQNSGLEPGDGSPIRLRPLAAAILSDKQSLVELALEHGADLQGRGSLGKTALHTAAILPDEKQAVLELLILRGANIDALAWNGDTPLMAAAMSGRAGAVKQLLDAGADPTLRNRWGETSLDIARSSRKDTEVIRLLEEQSNASRVEEE